MQNLQRCMENVVEEEGLALFRVFEFKHIMMDF